MEILTEVVEGVIIAAGFSSRASGWKMAFDIGGLTVIERCILGMVQFCSRILVVGGEHFHLLQGLLPKRKYPKVELVYNKDYQQGMFSSVVPGFYEVREPRFFFIPGDYPLVSNNVYEILLRVEGDIIIPAYQGITGHPVLFRTETVNKLFDIPGKYKKLNEFVMSQGNIIVEVADPGIIMDIDTSEDYQRAVRYFYLNK